MKRHLRLVASEGELIQSTSTEIEPYSYEEESEIPLLDFKEDIKDEAKERLNGYIGWLVTGAVVAAWDYSRNNETMTSAFRRAKEHDNPWIRRAALGSLAIGGAHLMGWLHPTVDPFNWAGKLSK